MAAIYGCTNIGVYNPHVNIGVWQTYEAKGKLIAEMVSQATLSASLTSTTKLQVESVEKLP